MKTTYIISCILFLIYIFAVLPACIIYLQRSMTKYSLGMPKSSIRALLAMGTIGVFLLLLSIGALVIEKEVFQMIVTSLTGLVGSIIGFYYGAKKTEDAKESGKDWYCGYVPNKPTCSEEHENRKKKVEKFIRF